MEEQEQEQSQSQSQPQPQSTEHAVEQPQYAGFWIRFVALIIDSLILGFVSLVLVLPLLGVLGMTVSDMGDFSEMEDTAMLGLLAGFGTTLYISNFIITWLYYSLLQSGKWQATLGKKAVGIKVTDLNGERISFLTATLRFFGKIISGMIMLIGYLMAAFTAKKQALHDMIASTYVVKTQT